MFLLVMLFNGASVSRCKLIDLMQASRRSEDMKEQPLGRSVVVFLIGVALIVAAYALLLLRGIFIIDAVFWLMLAMGTAGTLLFFRSLSGFLLKLCRGNKRFYYKGLNMFTLRQFNSRIHTNYLSMTVICLMLLLAIGITACAVGMNNTMDAMTDEQAPFDITVQNQSADTEGEVDFAALIRDAGQDPDRLLSEQFSFVAYYNDPEKTGEADVSAAIALSDYNTLLAMQGKEGIVLAPGEHRLLDNGENLVTGNLGLTAVIVEDEVAQQLPVRRQIWSANYAGDHEATEETLMQLIRPLAAEYAIGVNSKLITYQDLMGSKVLVIFLGLYLGVTFLLASAAVLALQQLSQAADNAYRYTLLAKLGAERKLRDRSVFIQVFLAFLLPLALAIVHAVVGMTSANAVIASVGKLDTTVSSAVTAAFLVVIYGAYFIATCLGCRRLARGR
jgi:putative ABC transport system permease protein